MRPETWTVPLYQTAKTPIRLSKQRPNPSQETPPSPSNRQRTRAKPTTTRLHPELHPEQSPPVAARTKAPYNSKETVKEEMKYKAVQEQWHDGGCRCNWADGCISYS